MVLSDRISTFSVGLFNIKLKIILNKIKIEKSSIQYLGNTMIKVACTNLICM